MLNNNLIKYPSQREKFKTMIGRESFRRLKKDKLEIDRGNEKKIEVDRSTVSKNFPELSQKPVEKYKRHYSLPYVENFATEDTLIERKMTEKEKRKDDRLKKKYDKSDMKKLSLIHI